MLNLLTPKLYVESIYALDLNYLKERDIKGIIADLDNTLVPWNTDDVCSELKEWIKNVREKQFKLCIVSNNSRERGEPLSYQLDVPAYWKAVKPRRKTFRKALKEMRLKAEEVAVVGDQIFTDVLGGNRLGLYTILVKPIDKKEFIGTRFVRRIEKIVLTILYRKGKI